MPPAMVARALRYRKGMTTHGFDSRQRDGRHGGFTLLELLVAVGLMTVVLGVATPMISTIRNRYVLDGASRQIAMEISRARMQAIAQGRTVRLRLDTANSYVIEASEDGTNFEPISDSFILPAGVAVTAGYTGSPRFNRQGMAPASTTLSVVSPAGTKMIQTSALGRVTRS